MKFYVTLHETHAVTYFVEAETEGEALKVAKDDLGAEVNRDFVDFVGDGEVESVEASLGRS
jgi:hypothetical protein